MTKHFQTEIEKLKRRVLSLGAIVEESIAKAISSLINRNVELAKKVIQNDSVVDKIEVEVEEECLKILALYQPVAGDLRFVIAVLKMNNDLERMGDLAANIAKRAIKISKLGQLTLPKDLPIMVEKVQNMVKCSIDSLINRDANMARKVCASDDEVDDFRRTLRNQIKKEIKKHPENVEELTELSSVFRHLERLGDMATNVAEDVIYMVEGEIIRHKGEIA
ncbi:MAG: phosphate signaling complex protein PhoU [Candidatus Marinimicrobia bacterium]|nr:phosphate signaling complex protein PhoU [Candidatus Neomarinimicrobiota bacterium]